MQSRIIFLSFMLMAEFTCSVYGQNVGIGVSNPTLGRLQVNGAVGRTVAIFGGDSLGISILRDFPGIGFNQYHDGNSAKIIRGGISGVQQFNPSTGTMKFEFFNSWGASQQPLSPEGKFTIRNNGNVTVNGDEENASLFVKTNLSLSRMTAAVLRGTAINSTIIQEGTEETIINGGLPLSDVYINDLPSLGNVYFGNPNSFVGINRSSPSSALEIGQVNSHGMILVNPNNFSNWEFVVTKNLTEPGSDLYLYYNEQYRGNFFHIDNRYYQLSDGRFKTKVTALPSVLEKVLQLRPVEYNYIHSIAASSKNIGFIAQEIRQQFPELVAVIGDSTSGFPDVTDLMIMNYDGLGPIAIKAIQEQQEKIRLLREQNAAIRKRLEAVKNRIQQ